MTENKTKPTLMNRLKKAVTNPFIMGAIAGISYFAGMKQNNNSQDSFDSIREAIGGQVTHAVFEGANGSKVEYFLDGKDFHRVVMKDAKGLETRAAFDGQTGDGVLRSSNGMTMRTESGKWVEGNLTEAQQSILDGLYDAHLDNHKGSLTKGQEALTKGDAAFDAYLMTQGKQNN